MVKSVAQQDLLALHRVGPSWSRAAPPCATSCAVCYASAAWWCGPERLRLSAACRQRWRIVSELSDEMRELLCEMSQWLRTLEQRIASCEAQRITRKSRRESARCADSACVTLMVNRSNRRVATLSPAMAHEAAQTDRERSARKSIKARALSRAQRAGRIYDCNRVPNRVRNHACTRAGFIYDWRMTESDANRSPRSVNRLTLKRRLTSWRLTVPD